MLKFIPTSDVFSFAAGIGNTAGKKHLNRLRIDRLTGGISLNGIVGAVSYVGASQGRLRMLI